MKRKIMINFFVFIGLLIVVNLLSLVVLLLVDLNNESKPKKVLPNYNNNREYYLQIVEEKSKIERVYSDFEGWKSLPFKGEYINIDINGFRKTISLNNKQEKTAIFLGGSVMWGNTAKDSESIPSIFAQQQPSFNVENFAELGFHSRQGLIRLLNQMSIGKKTNLVISMDGINEIYQYCISDNQLNGHHFGEDFRQKIKRGNISGIKAIIQSSKSLFFSLFLEQTLKLTTKLNNKWFKNKTIKNRYCCDQNIEKSKAIVDQMIKNWEMMHQIVEGNGGQFIAILQPISSFSQSRKDHLSISATKLKQTEIVYPLMQQKIKELNYDWIYDFTTVFDDYEEDYIFVDDCHVSPNGNQIIAETILDIFNKNE